MSWWGRVFSRFTLVSLAILAQLFWMFFFIHRLSDHYMIVAAAFNFVTLIAAVIIVNKNGNGMDCADSGVSAFRWDPVLSLRR